MIYIIFLWLLPSTLATIICYYDAKKYHYTVSCFLGECVLSFFIPVASIMYLAFRLKQYLNFEFPNIKVNTDFITKFLNKRL
jgi:hypothetical protein